MKYTTTLLFATFFFTLLGCSNGSGNDKQDPEKSMSRKENTRVDTVIKVYVEQTGKITADGNEVSLSYLDSSFNKLKDRNGTVYYSRANAQGDPPQESIKVMDLIVKYNLPVKMFTDKTFTVVFTPE